MNAVEKTIDLMKKEIEKYGLEILQRYPDDLLVHDRAAIERLATPGAIAAWMVGNSHTHLTLLGVHTKANELVGCLTNLASEDRFYTLKYDSSGNPKLAEVDRKAFEQLAATPVPYCREGSASDFWLMRGKARVGHVKLTPVGTYESPSYDADLSPEAGISGVDRMALEHWATRAVVECAHTLFVRHRMQWNEPLQLAA